MGGGDALFDGKIWMRLPPRRRSDARGGIVRGPAVVRILDMLAAPRTIDVTGGFVQQLHLERGGIAGGSLGGDAARFPEVGVQRFAPRAVAHRAAPAR